MVGDEYRLLSAAEIYPQSGSAALADSGNPAKADTGAGPAAAETPPACSVVVCGNNCTVTQTSIGTPHRAFRFRDTLQHSWASSFSDIIVIPLMEVGK
jgi:hypothetical protein